MCARALRVPTLAAFALVIAAAAPRVSLARLARDTGAKNVPSPLASFSRDSRDASFADRHDERRGELPRASRTTAFALGAFALVLVAGTMAGLTVGLLGVDPIELELRKEAELPEEENEARRRLRRDRDDAKKIWDVVASHHWLLCTLLLVNAAASEALPLCLDAILPEYSVIVVSVTLVLVFGEILPSAVFTGPRRTRLAAGCGPFVRALMWLTAPVSWPLGRALDHIVGEAHVSTRLDRAQIGTLIGLHGRALSLAEPARAEKPARRARTSGAALERDEETSPLLADDVDRRAAGALNDTSGPTLPRRSTRSRNGRSRSTWFENVWFKSRGGAGAASGRSPRRAPSSRIVPQSPRRRGGVLSDDEVTIVRETLKLAQKSVSDAMTPLRSVHMLPWESTVFDEDTLARVLGAGFSRIPVFRGGDKHNVVGTLMVKKLIVLDPNERRHVRDLPLRAPLIAHPDAGLLETLNAFQAGRSHMALVTRHASRLERAWRLDEDVVGGAAEILGIITVEDVLEELIGEEIQDEDDYAEALTRGPVASSNATRRDRAPRAPARTGGVSSVRLAFDERRVAPRARETDVSRRPEIGPEIGEARGEDASVLVSRTRRVRSATEQTEQTEETQSRTRGGDAPFPPAAFAAARKFKLLLARRRARRLRRSDSLESRD